MSARQRPDPMTGLASIPDIAWSTGAAPDCRAAAELAARAFDPEFQEAWTEAQLAAVAALPGGWLDLGRGSDGRLVAFALSRQVVEDVELLLCAVDPGVRRSGIGRRLLHEVHRSARERHASRIYLEVRSSNDAARGLYMSYGFVVCGRRPRYYRTVSGEMIDAITLELRI